MRVSALACRTWATSQQSPYLLAHLEWWRAYYHFVRPPNRPLVWVVCARELCSLCRTQQPIQFTLDHVACLFSATGMTDAKRNCSPLPLLFTFISYAHSPLHP